MDWKNRLTSINNKVKAQLFAKKVGNFAWIYQCIHEFDPKSEGSLSLHDFNLFLNKIGVFLTTQELRTIRDRFDYNNDTRIFYTDFLNNVRNDISERLQGVIDSTFDYLDYKKQGKLDLEELCLRYRSKEHPHAATRKKFAEDISNEFTQGLKLKSSDGKTLSKQEFTDYYADLNACTPIEREDFFLEAILKTWGLTHGKDYVSAARLHQLEDILFEKIRQKTDTKDSEGKAAKTAFKYFDLEDSGHCNLENFTRALDKFGCKFSTD